MSSNMKDFVRHAVCGVATAAVLGGLAAADTINWSSLGVYGPLIATVVHATVSAVNSSLRS